MTYRDRREAKADRLRDWAASREAKSTAAFDKAHTIAASIPFGQPILVGHHSERHARRDQSRIESGMIAGFEHSKKAEQFESRADGIESQLAHSIYSDDSDAVEKLRERIASLEAERDRIKAYNASCRKGTPDTSLLDAKQRADLLSIAKACAWQLGKNGAMPAYQLSNLGGNITRNKKRLAQIERQAAAVESGERGHGRTMASRYGGTCPDCGSDFARGDTITYYRLTREAVCESCS